MKTVDLRNVVDDSSEKTYTSVFISHSDKDKGVAKDVYNYLSNKGIRCWASFYDIPPSMSYPQAIMDGIASTDYLLGKIRGHTLQESEIS